MGNKCCRPRSEKIERNMNDDQEGMELPTRSIDESSNAISSTMRIEVHIKCEGLPSIEGKSEQDKLLLSYKAEYGSGQVFKWFEKFDNSTRPKISNKPFIVPYEMGTDQSLRITLHRFEDVKELKDPTIKSPFGSVLLDLNDAIVSKTHEIRKRMIILDETYKNAETFITVSTVEKKQENLAQLVIQFEIVDCKLKGPLFYSTYQKVGDGLKFICTSKISEARKDQPKIFSFEPLVLSSESFEGPWEEKVLFFAFEDNSSAKKKNDSSAIGLINPSAKSLATCEIPIKDLVQQNMQELVIETKNKKFGRVLVKNKTVEPILTLGSILYSDLKIVPIIAVDCSLGNLTFDTLKCMHHFDKNRPNYYIEALSAIESRVAPFYTKMLGYGFGAKVIPKKTRLSSCFALNGNIFDPTMKNKEELLASYIKTIKSVELCLPVNYSEVIKTAKELAQLELKEFKRRFRFSQHNLNSSGTNAVTSMLQNYYVLYIVTAGVLDDLEEVFNECSNIAGLPLSIVFVKTGNQQMKDVDDLGDLKKRVEMNYCQSRHFISLVEFDRAYNDLTNFGKYLISSVPLHILQFFKMQQRRMTGSASDLLADNLGFTPLPGKQIEEEEKEGLSKQQGPNPAAFEDNFGEYFEKLKIEYYQKMRLKQINPEEIEKIIKNGIPEVNPDFPIDLSKKDHKLV